MEEKALGAAPGTGPHAVRGLWSEDPVDLEAVLVLEASQGLVRLPAEDAVDGEPGAHTGACVLVVQLDLQEPDTATVAASSQVLVAEDRRAAGMRCELRGRDDGLVRVGHGCAVCVRLRDRTGDDRRGQRSDLVGLGRGAVGVDRCVGPGEVSCEQEADHHEQQQRELPCEVT